MTDAPVLTVAAVQETPVLFDREATLRSAADTIHQIAKDGADLVVFPESFVPGYPDFVWRHTPWADAEWYRRFCEAAVVPDRDLESIAEAARDTETWVALGVTERGPTDTLYNSIVYINDRGNVEAIHRKLMPTGAEQLVWANGQDHVLATVSIRGVRVGALICWENYMPLARMAMYRQGVEVLLCPTWDNDPVWVPTLQHIAKEGRLYVVGLTSFLRGSDVPRELPGADEIYGGEDDFMSRGNTTIVRPGGAILDGPLTGETGVLRETLDIGSVADGRRRFDPVGHYSRPDVVDFVCNVPLS